jgi:hypothetical protein
LPFANGIAFAELLLDKPVGLIIVELSGTETNIFPKGTTEQHKTKTCQSNEIQEDN